MSKKIFFFHYNKPLSKQKKRPMISIHYNKKCIMVENLVVNVPTKGRIRNRQPYFVIVGRAEKIEVINSVAYIS